jgi:hypothetical protein
VAVALECWNENREQSLESFAAHAIGCLPKDYQCLPRPPCANVT